MLVTCFVLFDVLTYMSPGLIECTVLEDAWLYRCA